MTTDYELFLTTKRITAAPSGFDAGAINPMLFEYQSDVVRWALKRGRAAIFSRYGTGKTPMQLEWARHVCDHTSGNVLILAPLAVAQQTMREGEKFGIAVNVCRTQSDVLPGINITNYEMLDHFDPSQFAGVVLDESSILKSYDGKTRTAIIEAFARTPYRLACTATPAPNDHMELGNHAEFLGIMNRTEMLSMFFTHDGGDTSKWRIKGHAEQEFWAWVCSWAVMLRTPSDLGYSNDGFDLPPLRYHQIEVTVDHQDQAPAGAQLYLMPVEALSLIDRRNARKVSMVDRVNAAAELVNASDESWIVWCGLNAESDALTKAINGAVEVTGSDTTEHKEASALWFTGMICDCQFDILRKGGDKSQWIKKNPKSANNTTTTTTSRPKASTSARRNSDQSTTPHAASDMQMTPNTESYISTTHDPAIKKSASTIASNQCSASEEKSTISSSLNKEEVARFVDAQCPMPEGTNSQLITATKQEQCEDYSAVAATSGLGSSETTQNDLKKPPCTCGGIKERRVLISKSSIFGFGMNWQHCHNAVYVGLSDSFEEMDQAIHRCHRYGQQQAVDVYIITSELEGAVVRNVERKRADHERMTDQMIAQMKDLNTANIHGLKRETTHYGASVVMRLPEWIRSAA